VEREAEGSTSGLDLLSGALFLYPQFCFVSAVWTDSAGSDPRVFKNSFTARYILTPVTRHFSTTTHIITTNAAVALCEMDNTVAIHESVKQFVASSTLYFSAGTKRRNPGLM
jgi:hypothetical protein